MTQKIPNLETIKFSRSGRLLTLTFNQPDTLNAVNLRMHEELVIAFNFASYDDSSDVIVVTGAGRAFSAGGDLTHIQNLAETPELFEKDADDAKQLVFTILDMKKPLICKMNGHAVGLGATIALLCDIVFASEGAKIGDPHVSLGLVAGDGGAFIWPQRAGYCIAKEMLLTGDLITAKRAFELGLINRCVPTEYLDEAVDEFSHRLLNGAIKSISMTKVLMNLELKRIAHAVMDAGLALEALSLRTEEHRSAVQALIERTKT